MNRLTSFFPKQICTPERQIVYDKKELFYLLNKYNFVKNKIYFSVYDCSNTMSFDNCNLDKIDFDFDKPTTETVLKVCKKLDEYNLMYLVVFSTRGFWIYIFTKNYGNIKNRKNCLTNAQNYVISVLLKDLNLVVDLGEKGDVCKSCIGDLARIARMPLSYDKERKLFCISISKEDMIIGYEHIRNKATKLNFDFFYYGNTLLDISLFDTEIGKDNNYDIPSYNYDELKISDSLVNTFLPCIKNVLLSKGEDTWDNRFLFALYCREMGINKSACDSIAQKYFGKTVRTDSLRNNYNHFKKFKVLEYAYSDKIEFFPSCKTLWERKVCKGKCDNFNKGVYR